MKKQQVLVLEELDNLALGEAIISTRALQQLYVELGGLARVKIAVEVCIVGVHAQELLLVHLQVPQVGRESWQKAAFLTFD